MELVELFLESANTDLAENSASVDHSAVLVREFECRRPLLLACCRRLLNDRDLARDAVNETWLKADRYFDHFDGRNWSGWLVRIAQRVCIDAIRAQLTAREAQAVKTYSNEDTEEHLINLIQVRQVLDSLPKDQRLCLKLFYIDGFSAKEIAERTGFSDKKIKSSLQNGRKNFARKWKTMSDPKDG